MKKIMAVMMVIVLVFAMTGVAFASTSDVISPEKGNTDVEPGGNGTTSPQTGESVNALWIAIAAVALLAIAFASIRKLMLVK